MGEDDVAEGRRILAQGKIPAYEKPEDAVKSFLNMVEYQRNLKLLTETPATIPHAFTPNTAKNRKIISDIASLWQDHFDSARSQGDPDQLRYSGSERWAGQKSTQKPGHWLRTSGFRSL